MCREMNHFLTELLIFVGVYVGFTKTFIRDLPVIFLGFIRRYMRYIRGFLRFTGNIPGGP